MPRLRLLLLLDLLQGLLDGFAAARRIDEETEPAYELLKVAPNPIAIKAALNLLGFEVGGLRLPLVSATPEETAQVRDCLERAGLRVPTPA